jgi:hypothetical protein
MQQIPPQQEVRSRVSKETRVTNRHRHSDVSAVLRKSKQTSQVRQSVLRTLSPNRQFFCNQRTSKRRRRRESCRRCLLKIPVLCCPAQLPRRIRILYMYLYTTYAPYVSKQVGNRGLSCTVYVSNTKEKSRQ